MARKGKPEVSFQLEDGEALSRTIIFLQDRVKQQENQIRQMQHAVYAAQTLRESVLNLSKTMPDPPHYVHSSKRQTGAEAVILMANDWQWGEVVNLTAMDGLNSYNVSIARKRAERFFKAAVNLATTYWSGPPPERVILVLGGDMISGEIHDELAKTNELLSIPALKDCASHIIAGVNLLFEKLTCPVDVICIPGNHGRVTKKPEHKLHVSTSYDTLLGDIVELYYSAGKRTRRPSFYSPASGDALFSLFGWRFLITHGDRIGSRGGTGTMGPAATVARGFKRVIQDYAARRSQLDYIICGHFHLSLKLEEGFTSGSLVGPSEFSRDTRLTPKPATQLFLSVHPARGVTQARDIMVGDRSEGTIYSPPKDVSTSMPLFGETKINP